MMHKMNLKSIFSLLLLILSFGCIDRYFFKQNDSFCLKQIFPKWAHLVHFETELSNEIHHILQQPFGYLCKGKQSFVFVSQDGQWVLKFPRLSREEMRLSWKSKRKSSFQKATKTVFEDLQEEAGLIYVHYQPTKILGKTLFIDHLGSEYLLPLDDFPFYLQKHGENFFSYFDHSEAPKILIEKTIQLFTSLYDKKIIDQDPLLETNFGIAEGSPFLLDFGQCEFSDSLPGREQYLLQMTHSLGSKLLRESPELYDYYKNFLQRKFPFGK